MLLPAVDAGELLCGRCYAYLARNQLFAWYDGVLPKEEVSHPRNAVALWPRVALSEANVAERSFHLMILSQETGMNVVID